MLQHGTGPGEATHKSRHRVRVCVPDAAREGRSTGSESAHACPGRGSREHAADGSLASFRSNGNVIRGVTAQVAATPGQHGPKIRHEKFQK